MGKVACYPLRERNNFLTQRAIVVKMHCEPLPSPLVSASSVLDV